MKRKKTRKTWGNALDLKWIVGAAVVQVVTETGHDQGQHFDLAQNLPPLRPLHPIPIENLFQVANSLLLNFRPIRYTQKTMFNLRLLPKLGRKRFTKFLKLQPETFDFFAWLFNPV